MNELDRAAADFLSLERIAVVGVSRRGDQPANLIYRQLRTAGHRVFAVNRNAQSVEGDPCYPSVLAIPGGVEGAVIVTCPQDSSAVVDECAAAGAGLLSSTARSAKAASRRRRSSAAGSTACE